MYIYICMYVCMYVCIYMRKSCQWSMQMQRLLCGYTHSQYKFNVCASQYSYLAGTVLNNKTMKTILPPKKG